jgi:UDP-glucose 4-epimerase
VARELSLDRFLYVSSGSVYGEGRGAQEVLNEDTVLYPRSLYAATKYTSELLTRRYGELHGFPTVSVRLSSPYGPMERVTGHRAVMSAPYECTGNVVRGEPIRVGERSLGRDYTYVADTAAGICTVLDAPALSYEVYNVTSGVLVTLGDMVSTLQQLRPTVQVIEQPSKEYGNLRPGANRGTMDATRLSQDLGFTASHDIRSGMEDYLLWRESLPFHD